MSALPGNAEINDTKQDVPLFSAKQAIPVLLEKLYGEQARQTLLKTCSTNEVKEILAMRQDKELLEDLWVSFLLTSEAARKPTLLEGSKVGFRALIERIYSTPIPSHWSFFINAECPCEWNATSFLCHELGEFRTYGEFYQHVGAITRLDEKAEPAKIVPTWQENLREGIMFVREPGLTLILESVPTTRLPKNVRRVEQPALAPPVFYVSYRYG